MGSRQGREWGHSGVAAAAMVSGSWCAAQSHPHPHHPPAYPAQVVLGQHAQHGIPQDGVGLAGKLVARGALLEAAWVPRVPAVELLVPLAPRQLNLAGIHHHHHVAVVLVGAKRGLVLALRTKRTGGEARCRGWPRAAAAAAQRSRRKAASASCVGLSLSKKALSGRSERRRRRRRLAHAAAHLQDGGDLRGQTAHHLSPCVHQAEAQALQGLHALRMRRQRRARSHSRQRAGVGRRAHLRDTSRPAATPRRPAPTAHPNELLASHAAACPPQLLGRVRATQAPGALAAFQDLQLRPAPPMAVAGHTAGGRQAGRGQRCRAGGRGL